MTKYEIEYNNLVRKCKSRGLRKPKNTDKNYKYYEIHHIIPKCMGGTDDKDNLVMFTFPEHVFAHALLSMIHLQDSYSNSLFYSFFNVYSKLDVDNQMKISPEYFDITYKTNLIEKCLNEARDFGVTKKQNNININNNRFAQYTKNSRRKKIRVIPDYKVRYYDRIVRKANGKTYKTKVKLKIY